MRFPVALVLAVVVAFAASSGTAFAEHDTDAHEISAARPASGFCARRSGDLGADVDVPPPVAVCAVVAIVATASADSSGSEDPPKSARLTSAAARAPPR